MLVIRLQRIGKIHQPSFRVVVAEKRSKLGGPPVEDLGFFDPFKKAGSIKKDRVLHWLKNGVQITPTVWNMLVSKGIVKGPRISIKLRKSKEVAPQAQAAPAAAEAPAETAAASS